MHKSDRILKSERISFHVYCTFILFFQFFFSMKKMYTFKYLHQMHLLTIFKTVRRQLWQLLEYNYFFRSLSTSKMSFTSVFSIIMTTISNFNKHFIIFKIFVHISNKQSHLNIILFHYLLNWFVAIQENVQNQLKFHSFY